MTPTTAILTGPTATGKTAAALALCARRPDIEIVNADSLLFYRGLDIGTAKPTPEERARVPHHLIDVITPAETFTAGDFHRACLETLDAIERRGKRALIVGGSGFYLKALVHGLWETPKASPELRRELEARPSQELYDSLYALDEESALRIGVNDRYRLVRAHEIFRQSGLTPSQLEAQQRAKAPDPRFRLLWIDRDPDELNPRIEARTRQMLEDGLIPETEQLIRDYPDARALLAIGYAETRAYIEGTPPPGRKQRPGLAGLAEEIDLSTRQLVKRQRTWFRNQFRDGGERTHEFILDRDLASLEARLTEIYG